MNRPAPKSPPARPALPNNAAKAVYWFILGREPLLSAAEIDAVLFSGKKNCFEYAPPLLKAAVPDELNPDLINHLGGTIKIAQEIGDGLTREELAKKIIEELKVAEGKIHFGLSWYGLGAFDLQKLGLEIKKEMKGQGYSVRYVENRTPQLSSVTVTVNNLIKKGGEFLISDKGGIFSLARTLAVQPYEEFSGRDYGRPGRDDKSGMLPPKLAMMMINLARAPKDGVLLDPFCGSGTILTEAMLLGYANVVGGDISEKAIADSQKNIEWTVKNKGAKLFQADISDLGKHLVPNSIDAIVTEPFLGKPLRGNESLTDLQKQINELESLYQTALGQFFKILRPDGTIVMIVPRYQFKNEWLRLNLDYKKNGLSPLPFFNNENFLLYYRPGQRLAREIWRFRR